MAFDSADRQRQMIISFAENVFENPFASSEEEKLNAIEYLESFKDDESVKILQSVVQTLRLPKNSPGTFKDNEDIEIEPEPRGGIVSGRAAHALAKGFNDNAFRYLVRTLKDQSTHPYIRESIVYGFGGVVASGAFNALRLALDDTSYLVRARATRSIAETLVTVPPRTWQPALDSLLERLAEKVLRVDSDELPLTRAAWKESIDILSQHLSDSPKGLMLDFMNQDADSISKVLAIEILSEHKSNDVVRALSACLLKKGIDEDVYKALGKALKGTRNPYAQQSASEILAEANRSSGFLGRMFAGRSPSFEARIEAAKKVLQTNGHHYHTVY